MRPSSFWVGGFACVTILAGLRSASADMIEIKGKGFLNGTIVSQDADHVVFKDSKEGLHDVPMKDVSFLERQKERAPASSLGDRASALLRQKKAAWVSRTVPKKASPVRNETSQGPLAGESGEMRELMARVPVGPSSRIVGSMDELGVAEAQLQVQRVRTDMESGGVGRSGETLFGPMQNEVRGGLPAEKKKKFGGL